MKSLWKLACFIICWTLGQTIALGSGTDLGKGIALYNQKQFRAAETRLASATVSDPTSAQAHYYLALALVKLKQFSLAQRHFKMSSMLDPNGTFGDYSREALQAYKTTKPIPPGVVPQMNYIPNKFWADSVSQPKSPKFNEAIRAYNEQRYHAAMALLNECSSSDVRNQELYLYFGRTYEKLKDPESARNSYLMAYTCAPFTPIGLTAKQALVELAASQQAKANAPVDDARTVQRALSTIQQQSADAQNRVAQEADTAARFRINLGAIEAANISGTAAGYYRGFRRDPYERREISNWERINTMYQTTDAQAQSDRARADGFLRQSFLQESANNLMSLIGAKKVLPDDAVLRALGTNLYVRYYGSPELDDLPPSDPIVELKATAQRLADFSNQRKTSSLTKRGINQ